MLKQERKEIAYFMRRLYRMGLTTTSGGNISIRCDNHVLLTPSALDKARIKANQVAIFTLDGENLTPDLKPTMEKEMHFAIYRKDRGVKAIVHAHPVTASAFACTHRTISTKMMVESYAILGIPVRAKYATMGSKALADHVAEAAIGNKVVIMENHGVLATGETLLQAFDRIEVLENAARTTLITEVLLKDQTTLSESELKILDQND
ncbi:MAG: class II aldolase/adducin family protein [Bacteroidota bacterium]